MIKELLLLLKCNVQLYLWVQCNAKGVCGQKSSSNFFCTTKLMLLPLLERDKTMLQQSLDHQHLSPSEELD